MDISRLPVVYLARPVLTTNKTHQAPAAENSAPRVERVAVRSRSADTLDDAVQGEFLQRERSGYQSTRAFINERNLNHAQSAGERGGGNAYQARSALMQYADNIRPEAQGELTQGRSINYFV